MAELRELTDRNEIADLISRLGLWLDEQRFDDPHAIFTGDVNVSTSGGTAQGIERLTEQARRNHAGFKRTQHVITNVLIDMGRDRADVGANLIVTFVHGDTAPEQHMALGERYRFETVRTPAGWRLSRVEVAPMWRSGHAATRATSGGSRAASAG